MGLPAGGAPIKSIEPKLILWLSSLAALAAFNVGLWIWIARSASTHSPYAQLQFLLSGVYVGVCGFRSLFPRVDLERILGKNDLMSVRYLEIGLRIARTVGREVHHETFGRGVVVMAEGEGSEIKFTVRFGSGTRKVLGRFLTGGTDVDPA